MANCPSCSDPGFLKFNRASHYGKTNFTTRLELGLKYFYEWAFLNIGAWSDVTIDLPTALGSNASILRMGSGYGYTDGTVWEGFRKEWVYESGVVYTDTTGGTHSPLTPSIYIDGNLQASGYSINYPLGQVIFDQAVSAASTVKAAHSFRNVQIVLAGHAPWYEELQHSSWEPDAMFSQTDRGDWFMGPNHRVQMPCIIIRAIAQGNSMPYALGGGKVKREQDVLFHIIAEDKTLVDNLTDIVVAEGYRCIQLFDIDAAAIAGDLPLDCNGNFVGKMYPELLTNYCWGTARSHKGVLFGSNTYNCGLHDSTVKHKYECIFSGIF